MKFDVRRIAIAGGVAVIVFSSVCLWFARRNHYRMRTRCDELLAPLAAQGAGPGEVEQRLHMSAETYTRERRDEILERMSRFSLSRSTLAGIREGVAQSARSRVYQDGTFVVYVVFYDESEHMRRYVCFENHE